MVSALARGSEKMRKIFWIGLFLFSFACACQFEKEEFELPERFFLIKILEGPTAKVIAPESFQPTVIYPGISAQRITDRIELKCQYLSQPQPQLHLTIKNISPEPLKRIWMIALDEENGEILDYNAVNGEKDKVIVVGNLSPGEEFSFDLNIKLSSLPAIFRLDFLQVFQKLAYASDKDSSIYRKIWTLEPQTKLPFQVTPKSQQRIRDNEPRWSPGMEWIAFTEFNYDQSELSSRIFIIHPDGSSRRQITPTGKWSESPVFSPNGKYLLYLCQSRTSSSSQDICLKSISSGQELVLIRGDGYYCRDGNCWDGSGDYQEFISQLGYSEFFRDKLYRPNWSPEGNLIIFFAQESELAPAPVVYKNRYLLLGMQFDPSQNLPISAPFLLGKIYDGDTISNSNFYLDLDECIPNLLSSGDMLCFLKEFTASSPGSFGKKASFYGIARIKMNDLLANPSDYLGNYTQLVYDIRAFKKQIQGDKKFYINSLDYSPVVSGVIFTVKLKDTLADLYLLRVDKNFQVLEEPELFYSNGWLNISPDFPVSVQKEFYRND